MVVFREAGYFPLSALAGGVCVHSSLCGVLRSVHWPYIIFQCRSDIDVAWNSINYGYTLSGSIICGIDIFSHQIRLIWPMFLCSSSQIHLLHAHASSGHGKRSGSIWSGWIWRMIWWIAWALGFAILVSHKAHAVIELLIVTIFRI